MFTKYFIITRKCLCQYTNFKKEDSKNCAYNMISIFKSHTSVFRKKGKNNPWENIDLDYFDNYCV